MVRRQSDNRFPWVNGIGLLILAACYLAALVNVVRQRSAETRTHTIRILHWQLELGVREGLAEVISRFEAAKRAEGLKVRVLQIPITERAYVQYVTTQMIGETAPDLIALGRSPPEFMGRYFLPLSRDILEPNPWIARRMAEWERQSERLPDEDRWLTVFRELANEPWMNTFKDSLRLMYNEDNQEYFGVGFSQFTVRMFYNRNIFREVLGTDRPPATFQELLDFSERIANRSSGDGAPRQAIAGAGYQAGILYRRLLTSATADLARAYDTNFDARVEPWEISVALLRGWNPLHPKYRAALSMMDRLVNYFPPGFMALGRMDAGFAFVQGRAAMILSGSWDAESFLRQIQSQPPEKRFEVGVFDLPMPTADDPEFGPYIAGRVSEADTGTAFAFGITRFSRHADLCLDFLQFATTPENNEILNRYPKWIPAVRGAQPTPLLAAFQPNYVGYHGQMGFHTGPRGQMLHTQVYWPLISGEIDYETYARRLMSELPAEAAVDWTRQYREHREVLPNRFARRAAFLATHVFAAEPETRAEDGLKAMRSWEALFGYLVGRPLMDGMLADVRAEFSSAADLTPFARDFFDRLRQEGL
jgi:raffinose/stachyose/melibiose transport system substrate-binding protein